jgi:Domain of unknown function (DUF5666)
MSNQTPDEFAQIGSDEEVDAALKPKKSLNLPLATAILTGVVVLAVGLAGGAGLHAAFASDNTSNAPQAGRGFGGYGGFRGQNGQTGQNGNGQNGNGQGQRFPGGQGGGTIGTVVSANSSELVVKTESGNVTVKLTGDTTYEITSKGTAADLKAGQQVVVSGQNSNGTITANTVRQGSFPGGGFRSPGTTPNR